jgi:hypothetical protein
MEVVVQNGLLVLEVILDDWSGLCICLCAFQPWLLLLLQSLPSARWHFELAHRDIVSIIAAHLEELLVTGDINGLGLNSVLQVLRPHEPARLF